MPSGLCENMLNLIVMLDIVFFRSIFQFKKHGFFICHPCLFHPGHNPLAMAMMALGMFLP
jgi:hypothetical protein